MRKFMNKDPTTQGNTQMDNEEHFSQSFESKAASSDIRKNKDDNNFLEGLSEALSSKQEVQYQTTSNPALS